MNSTGSRIEFRRMAPTDVPGGLRLCRLSGWDQLERDWTRFLQEDATATAAIRNGELAGTSATIAYGSDFGWIGMVLVDPAAKGEGLGTALLARAIEALRDVSAARLDATPAGHPLYLKHGFAEEYRLARRESDARVRRDAADSAAKPMTEADLEEVSSMDLRVFGAPRSRLLAWMLDGAPEYATVVRQSGRLRGYSFGRHGFAFEHLGPIVAEDASVADLILRVGLSRCGERPFLIDASCHDGNWTASLEREGFREQRPFVRMHRGGRMPFGIPEQQFAVLGPEFG